MKYLITLILILLSIILKIPGKNIIKWSINTKLEWNDFKETIKGNKPIALTVSGIEFKQKTENDTAIYLQIYAAFDKDRSAKVENKHELDYYRLKHEQIHFDITEWYTRILRKALTDTILSTENDFLKIYHEIFRNLKKMQKRYDSATDFANDSAQQYKWNDYVAEKLNEYSAFANTEVTVHIERRINVR